jgi:hypothetical protein
MDYLTQYYKNRCNQLQEQISQINSELRNLSEYVVEPNIGTAKTGMSTQTSYGGGGVSNDIISEFLSRWGQPGYDGAGLGRLLASMVPTGGNGVDGLAQRIMSGSENSMNTSTGRGNDVDTFNNTNNTGNRPGIKNPMSTSTGRGNGVGTFNGTNNTGNQQTLDQFLSNWGQPGYDGAGLGQLLSNMIPSNNTYQSYTPQKINRKRKLTN